MPTKKKPGVPAAVSAYFSKLGKSAWKGTPAQLDAVRRNAAVAEGRRTYPLDAQYAALLEAVLRGGRPPIGPKLAEFTARQKVTDPDLKAALAACPRAARTLWTVTARAKELAGLGE